MSILLIEKRISRRKLPHFESRRDTIFVTISLLPGIRMTSVMKSIVFRACLFYDSKLVKILQLAVMPTHVHILLTLIDLSSVSTFVQKVKSFSAHKMKELDELRRSNWWLPDYFDRTIATDEQKQTVYEYIKHNPIKEGLAASAEEYPWYYENF